MIIMDIDIDIDIDTDIDIDNYKGYKIRIITLFGTQYELKHKNNRILNNNIWIYMSLATYLIKKYLYNFNICKKLLMFFCIFIINFIYVIQYANNYISRCIDNKLYMINTDIIYIYIYGFYDFWIIIIGLYLFLFCWEKLTYFIDITVNKYNEYIPTIENII
jgi:hypothetical protein